MSSRDDRERSWRTNPEATTASGGHLTPDPAAGDPWADPLAAPLPSETARRTETWERDRGARPEAERGLGSVSSSARTEMFPPSEETLKREGEVQRTTTRTVRRRVPVRRVKRTLRHVDPLTVLKLSAFYWAVFLVVWLVIVAILYSIINGVGFFDRVEKISNGLALGWGKIDITLGLVERWAFLIGLTVAVIASLVNVFLAFLYNVAADLIGGLELTFVERDN